MAICVYGGAFDPVHMGHEVIIDFLAAKKEVDQLLLVPTGIPVYKKTTFFSDAFRLQMVKSVAAKYQNVDVIDYEIQRKTPSYTVDT